MIIEDMYMHVGACVSMISLQTAESLESRVYDRTIVLK